MANENQIRILWQGAKAWNKWRMKNPNEHLDLSEAYLRSENLSEADLRKVDLYEADLSDVILRKANLEEANLSGVILSKANLEEADLNGADLSEANLFKAFLYKAKLHKTNLSKANLYEANLREADLSEANLTKADLSGVNLIEAYIREADLSEADLHRANLYKADLYGANLGEAYILRSDLSEANLREADLSRAVLTEANLREADLSEADLSGATLSEADLSGANITKAVLVETDLGRATLTGCKIYGISAWELKLEDAKQTDLIITPLGQPSITVDNLEVAQFIYLLLRNENIRHVIDTITSKVVLILGCFTKERKDVLEAIRVELRKRGYLPILFDFETPTGRDLTETISTLAHMARFVIADITDAKAVPIELKHIVPMLPSVPVQPLILDSQYEYALFDHIRGFRSVLEPYRYENQRQLLATIEKKVIAPAEEKVREIRKA